MTSPEMYAQSLRANGQALETLRIKAFTLEKKGDKYTVSDWEPSFLEGVTAGVGGKNDVGQMHPPPQSAGKMLLYTNADAERLDAQGRAKRSSTGSAGAYTISSGLRALGDYLDKKRAVTFVILWSHLSATVKCETAGGTVLQTSFSLQELQDLAVGMYMRRSNR